jgi:hypothetical protein
MSPGPKKEDGPVARLPGAAGLRAGLELGLLARAQECTFPCRNGGRSGSPSLAAP